MMNRKPKVLLFDVETFPNLGYTWGKWEQNVVKFVKEWELASFAFKTLGEDNITCHSRKDHSEKELVSKLHRTLDSADIVIAHNGDSFDLKKSRTKFLQFNLKPLRLNRSIDTMKIAKTQFAFNSNSLGDLGEFLGLGKKVDTGGFDLWLECMSGNSRAWGKMIEYNKQDVRLLEKVYLKLRSWAPNHPNLAAFVECPGCSACGSTHIQFRGTYIKRQKLARRYQCQTCWYWGSV